MSSMERGGEMDAASSQALIHIQEPQLTLDSRMAHQGTNAPQPAEPMAQLQEFHQFPDLPVELQTRIFKFALPDQHRVLQVLPRQHIPLTSQMPWFIFRLSRSLDRTPIRSAAAISRACFTSRQVYEKLLPDFLPCPARTTPWPGALRFDKSRTLIYIPNTMHCLQDVALRDRTKEGSLDQLSCDSRDGKWPVNIMHLATNMDSFPPESSRLFRVLARFPRLKSFVIFTDKSSVIHRLCGRQHSPPSQEDGQCLADIAKKLENILNVPKYQQLIKELWTDYSTPKVYCRSPEGVYVDGDGKEYEFPVVEEIKVETKIENGQKEHEPV